MDRQRVHGVFVPFTRGCSSSEELYGAPSILDDVRLPAGTGEGRGRSELVYAGVRLPLFHRLVNRNNCVQKLRATLIVTWQANRIDTPLPPRAPRAPRTAPVHPGPFVRPAGYYQISLRRIRPAKYVRPVSRSCSGRMHGARNELPRPVNYALSLPIGNNVPRGLLIAGRIIRMLRRTGILPLPWTPY